MTIQPGASTSTADVYNGLVAGLKELGHEVINYQLDVRIARAGAWLDFSYERAKAVNPDIPRPTTGDVLFQACGDSVVKAMWKKPDWVIVVSAMYYPKTFLKLLKQGGLNVALLLTESPYDDEQQYALAATVDICWTNERTSVDRLRICNPETYYLPHAYDPGRHCPTNGDAPDVAAHDVVFVGTAFQERIDLLEAVDWSGIDLGLYGNWDTVHSRSKLQQYIKAEEISNDMAAALYRHAKIGLNLYRSSKGFGPTVPRTYHAESLNPRAYELAACGCFHLSDARAEVDEVFAGLVPTFSDGRELESQIRGWLEDDKLRTEIASRLPKCVEGQTWLKRARQMVTDLEHAAPVLARR